MLTYLFLGRSAKTWDSWCISKNTNGDACNWYTYVRTKEIKKCATNKGYDSPYHLSSHFALKSEDHSLNLLFQHQTFALWSACNVGIANIAKRERNKGAKQLDALMKVSLFVFLLCWPSSFILITERPYVCQELSVPLRTYTENFPKRRDLHPYERSLIELTFGEGYYEQV